MTPQIAGAAFTDSISGVKTSTLHAYDIGRNALIAEEAPGSGIFRTVSRFQNPDIRGPISFDIASRLAGQGHSFAVTMLQVANLPGSTSISLSDRTAGTGEGSAIFGILATGIAIDDPALFTGGFE